MSSGGATGCPDGPGRTRAPAEAIGVARFVIEHRAECEGLALEGRQQGATGCPDSPGWNRPLRRNHWCSKICD